MNEQMPNLAGKTAIVTGGSRGIGAAICQALASSGASVVVNYAHRKDAAEEVVQAIQDTGGKATAAQADVSEPDQFRELFETAEKTFGPVDILVNNAGIVLYKAVVDVTDEEFDRLMATNIKGVFNGLREAATRLQDNGSVVNLSTTALRLMQPTYGPYCASKAAVEQLTRSFAKEMGPRGIRVNAVSPGPTETEMFLGNKSEEVIQRFREFAALSRLGRPEDIGPIVAFLCSAEAGWITGQILAANGGIA